MLHRHTCPYLSIPVHPAAIVFPNALPCAVGCGGQRLPTLFDYIKPLSEAYPPLMAVERVLVQFSNPNGIALFGLGLISPSLSSPSLFFLMHIGFLRFLELLSTHPWHSRPLVVDPERQLSKAQRQAIVKRYDSRRAASTQHLPAMYICTAKDTESRHW